MEEIFVDEKLFLGRLEEQKQFTSALHELINTNDADPLPFVFLLYGDGGIGKTTLAKRFRDIVSTNDKFSGKFQTLWIDWEDERKRTANLQVGHEQITADAVFRAIYAVALRQKWGRQFVSYNKSIKQGSETEKRVAEILTGDDVNDEIALIRTIGVNGLAKIIRAKLPFIGEKGEDVARTFLDHGIEMTAKQAYKSRQVLETYLRARLDPNFFEHFLNPEENLALALARGIENVAAKKKLVIFLDSYEIIDRIDIWMRTVIQAAGSDVVWVISGRNDLVHSRQFGQEYFKGYADDMPRRFLPIQIRPLALAHIETYFKAAEIKLARPEIEAISRVTRGIPLAVQTAADILKSGADLLEVIGDINSAIAGEQIVRRMTDRYLQHVVADEDMQALYALALARGDVDILRSMLQPAEQGNFNLDKLLRRLERTYASVHAQKAQLHDNPAHFITEYLRNKIRRTDEKVRTLNESAITVLDRRLEKLEEKRPSLEDRCQDENWVKSANDKTHFLLWINEDEGLHWLLPRFVEGLGYNENLCRSLIQTAQENQELLNNGGQFLISRLGAMQQDSASAAGAEKGLELLQQMTRRGWLKGENEAERETILHFIHGTLLSRRHQSAAAMTQFSKVEAGLPENGRLLAEKLSTALEDLARQQMWQKSPVAADQLLDPEPILEKVVALQPDRVSAWYLLGQAQQRAGKLEASRHSHQKAVSLDKNHVSARNSLGDVLREMGDHEEALVSYESASKVRAKHPTPYLGMGNVYLAAGKIDEAIRAFQKAIDRDPLAAPAHYHLGEAYLQAEDKEHALESLQEAVRLAPNFAPPYQKLGDLQFENGAIAEAKTLYEKALALDNNNGPAQLGWANVLWAEGAQNAAFAAYRRAIPLLPHHPIPYYRLGQMYQKLGRFDEAIASLEKSITRDPTFIAAHLTLAEIYQQQGLLQPAEEVISHTIDLDSTAVEPHVRLGRLRLQQGDLDRARQIFSDLIARHPDTAVAHLGLGETALQTGDLAAAQTAFRKVIELDPRRRRLLPSRLAPDAGRRPGGGQSPFPASIGTGSGVSRRSARHRRHLSQ
jgi:tetratricopeptide (TPR) repeat protein